MTICTPTPPYQPIAFVFFSLPFFIPTPESLSFQLHYDDMFSQVTDENTFVGNRGPANIQTARMGTRLSKIHFLRETARPQTCSSFGHTWDETLGHTVSISVALSQA